MPASADSKHKRVANGGPATHQTVRQQGGTGEDGHIHLADWALSVPAIEKSHDAVKIFVFLYTRHYTHTLYSLQHTHIHTRTHWYTLMTLVQNPAVGLGDQDLSTHVTIAKERISLRSNRLPTKMLNELANYMTVKRSLITRKTHREYFA